MPLSRIVIKNYKSIKECDISVSELNVLIGENGTGKTNLLDAIHYFYRSLSSSNISGDVFDENNRYSNEVRIALIYDLSSFVKISKSQTSKLPDLFGDKPIETTKYAGYYNTIISMASKSDSNLLRLELSQVKGRPVQWNYSYDDRLIFKSLFPVFFIDTRNLDVTEWGYLWDVLGEIAKVSNAERKTIEGAVSSMLLDREKKISGKLKGIMEIFDQAGVSVKHEISKEFAQNLAKVFFSGSEIQQSGKKLDYLRLRQNVWKGQRPGRVTGMSEQHSIIIASMFSVFRNP